MLRANSTTMFGGLAPTFGWSLGSLDGRTRTESAHVSAKR